MTHPHDLHSLSTRRQFFGRTATGIGSLALSSMLNGDTPLNFAPKAKRIIYLFQSGGPSQMELFDYKPTLGRFHGQELPASIRMGQEERGRCAKCAKQCLDDAVGQQFSSDTHPTCGPVSFRLQEAA